MEDEARRFRLSRGAVLRRAAAISGGAALAGAGAPLGITAAGAQRRHVGTRVEPFYGAQQGGIATTMQASLQFAAFDVICGTRDELRALLHDLSAAAAELCAGRPDGAVDGDQNAAPQDTGEALGLPAARLTVTFGLGPSLFDGRYGLAARRPPALADLPAFPGDALEPARCGGDLAVQACADDPQVAFHAVRQLVKVADGRAVPRWSQTGFARATGEPHAHQTSRNLLGFRDGTNNLDARDPARMARNVWAQPGDGPDWMAGGSYLVARRIVLRLLDWDRSDLDEQEQTFGRHKVSGAPFGGRREFAPVDPAKLPPQCHVILANPRVAGSEDERILRRGYSFADGVDPATGDQQAGLFFVAFQRDPRRQFVPIQTRLAAGDLLNEYTQHTGSALFACPPGCRPGGFIGETLLG